MKKKVMTVFGTRPEAIKMAPVVTAIAQSKRMELITAVTGQHRDMLDQVMELFDIEADYDLNVMLEGQSLEEVTTRVIEGLKDIYKKESPDVVLVHGDTSTAFAAALGAYYHKIPVGHVEAGLRSDDIYNPFPEEINRRLVDTLASYHFAPTSGNSRNLLKENIKENVFITGNTVIDALLAAAKKELKPVSRELLRQQESKRKYILITAHRRENFGKPLENICMGIKKLAVKYPDIDFIYPVHPNPNVKGPVEENLGLVTNIKLIKPVSYSDMVWLLKNSYFCMTDSGGIQEEAPTFGKPVLVLRKVTERPEAVEAGTVDVIGTNPEIIYSSAEKLINDHEFYNKYSRAHNPYGDGLAAKRTVEYLEYKLGLRKKEPEPWKI
ncbi:MAG: UDP-N-acetylglucosamine 2-epimerase (non-hydrolyzing) [Elusimicrobia bacterium]|jgi:UDP-N-acetylglucosamine 2-epimerase (non-hydrolysing)|nr:UDP-N-acetylglucosamine 2-epimerase (non-hydrolyzing) [Elusimicrobiota bacterium]